jgi:methyl-galactoside transport system ATP-binding protein
MSEQDYVLEARNVSKSFPGVKALNRVTLKIRPGTVHALMGENGAGKSTLMKCIFGLYTMDEGQIIIGGKEVHINHPRDVMDLGVSMIHQELHSIPPQNVMENIWVGRIPYRKRLGIQWVDKKSMYEATREIFKKFDLAIDPKVKVSTLATSYCQLLEIARAVSFGAKVIIMDEPTSSLTEKESEILFRIISQLRSENVAVIYISHKIDEILRISDEVTIMRDGGIVGTWNADELTTDLIVNRMVGREMTNRFPPHNHIPGDVWMEVSNLSSADPHSFTDISFEVRRGEIFGIGGLVGSQRTELIESIFGLRPLSSGCIVIHGLPVRISCPKDAIQNGMALLTEERRAKGIFGVLSITDNIVMVRQNLKPGIYHGKTKIFLDRKKRDADAHRYTDTLRIKTPSLKTRILNLSGGNQQKTLVGRWLLTKPTILIMDEPTRGIDVGAKYEIYELMEELVREGKCVIMVSSEMPELIGMSDRIMVMCEGHLSGIVKRDEATEERIMSLASTYKKGQGV